MKAYIIYTNDNDRINQYYELEHVYIEARKYSENFSADHKNTAKISVLGEIPSNSDSIDLNMLIGLQKAINDAKHIADRGQQRD